MIFERIIRLPWWLFAAVSAVFFALALAGGDWAKERGSAIRAVMERPSAPVVAFDALQVGSAAYVEAAFEAQIITSGATEISGTWDGDEVISGTFLPLAGVPATEPPMPYRAAIFVRSGPMQANWRDWIEPFVTGEGPLGPVVSLEGEIVADHDAAELVQAEIGAEAVKGVIWVRPYRDGRQAALDRSLGLLGWGALPFWGLGIFFAAMSGARFFASRGG